jgi:hypothetical protein
MKHYQKLCSCFIIVALCVAGMTLGGCKKAREKKHKMSVATGAVVNSMMVTNPLGVLFGAKSSESAEQKSGVQSMAALTGCPQITFSFINFSLIPLNYSADINITYSPDCLVNGIAMSGTVAGHWELKKAGLFDIYIETQLAVDNITMEGLTTNGSIHQQLYSDFGKYLSQIDGDMLTIHADGRTRSITFDNLTSEVSASKFLDQLLSGSSTLDVPSQVINGGATYTDEDGNTYIMDFDNVTQPFTCPMPTSGTVHIVNTAEEFDAMIDYADTDGGCDSIVTITMAGEEPQEVDVTKYVNKHQYRF